MSRTGVRLEFPHVVKFQTDSCLKCGSMKIICESTLNGQLSNRAELWVILTASLDFLCLSHGPMYLPVNIKHASSKPNGSNPCIGLMLCARVTKFFPRRETSHVPASKEFFPELSIFATMNLQKKSSGDLYAAVS